VAGHTATTRYPQFEGFIDETLEEAFFIKNLEPLVPPPGR
jgi:hypothetical protein